MKFAANLSFMFRERSMFERYFAAKEAGFKGVECAFPQADEIFVHQLCEAKQHSNVEQVLINIYTGNVKNRELGCAFVPGKEKEFADCLTKTISLARILNCKRIHIMSGIASDDNHPIEMQNKTFIQNLTYAADVLSKENIIGLIEPINQKSVPGYWLSDYETASSFIRDVGRPNIKLLLDIFHCQIINGNITNAIDKYYDLIGHVQIAQVPHRGEPNTPGELNYKYILNYLDSKGYDGWVGLEYIPVSNTEHGLHWLNEFGYNLNPEN